MMITELQKCPSLYATGEQKTTIMCGMSNTAEELAVYAHSVATGLSFKRVYDESALAAVRSRVSEGLTWARFYELLADGFNSACVTSRIIAAARGDPTTGVAAAGGYGGVGLAADGSSSIGQELQVVCTPAGATRPIVFSVPSSAESTQAHILSHMVKGQQVIARPKDHQQQLARLATEEAAVAAQRDSLEKEALALRDNLARNRSQEEQSNRRLAELRREFNPSQAESADDPWRAVYARQVQSGTANAHRLPNPMVDRVCKDYDPALLRLVKSRFLTPDMCQKGSPAHSVIQPYSAAELAQLTRGFPSPTYEVVWRALDRIDDWAYNVFEVQTAMAGDDYASLPMQPHGGSLFITLYALLCKNNSLQKFNIDEQATLNWISVVEAGYHGNPYHNSMHAADVVQITNFILTKGGLAKRCELSDLDVLSAILAAAVHDFDHPGINNNFHIKSGSYLATLYNDRSVLENLHVSSIFELMKNREFNILAGLSDEQRKEVRETMVEMVLATDMGLHGKYVARMKGKLQERASFLKREDQLLALCMALKMADISNCGRPNDIYLKWSGKVSDEFYQQGDRERGLGLACSPFMDRMQPALAKGQISFMNYIIIPFFEQLSELLPDLRFAVDLAEANRGYWAQNDDSGGAKA